jgi:hypothetical protein
VHFQIRKALAGHQTVATTFEGYVAQVITQDTQLAEFASETRSYQQSHQPSKPNNPKPFIPSTSNNPKPFTSNHQGKAPQNPVKPFVKPASTPNSSTRPPSSTPSLPAYKPPAKDPNAMDIDGQRRFLPKAERDRYMAEGRCFMCGERGHTAQQHRAQLAAVETPAPVQEADEEDSDSGKDEH